MASYALKQFGTEIDVTLFKFPEELEQAINEEPPHILGCSNYCWNENLSYHFVNLVKSHNEEIITVFGGTNYPFDAKNQKKFLKKRPNLDIHAFYEGETAFSNLIERYLSVSNYKEVFSEPIAGCHFLNSNHELICGEPVPRIGTLNDIPSPYTEGLLDKFFEAKLTPLLETSRGCPFRCNFCNAGDSYYTKTNLFSNEYVKEEWTYVAKQSSKHGITHMTLCDANFGMIPRDTETSKLLLKLQSKYGWPQTITAWTGKNAKERVIEATKILGETLSISMSVQSMDQSVLKNIERDNIKLDHYRDIANELNDQGRPQYAEVIIPLPGETFKSYLNGLHDLMDTNLSNVDSYTLTMLHGTPYKDDAEFRRKHGYITKHRIVPLDFGIYNSEYVFETEEVGIATNTFSFEEYVEARKFLFIMDLCYNGDTFSALKKYILSNGLKRSEWINYIYQNISMFTDSIKKIFDSFVDETCSELWNTQDEIISYYSSDENYQKLVAGDSGGNVLFRHKTLLMSEVGEEWIDIVFLITDQFLKKKLTKENKMFQDELPEIKTFTKCIVEDAFNFDNPEMILTETFRYDFLGWLNSTPETSLQNYLNDSHITLEFSFKKEQLVLKSDAMERYGKELSGIVKLIQRVGGIHRFMRKVSYGSLDQMGNHSTDEFNAQPRANSTHREFVELPS